MNQNAKMTDTPVPIDVAAPETQNWRDFVLSVTRNDASARVNGYYIPLDDMQTIVDYVNSIKGEGVRAYFAMPKPNEGPVNGQSCVHIYVVPVDGDGNDVLSDENNPSLIYDTTQPCPTMCGAPNQINSDQ